MFCSKRQTHTCGYMCYMLHILQESNNRRKLTRQDKKDKIAHDKTRQDKMQRSHLPPALTVWQASPGPSQPAIHKVTKADTARESNWSCHPYKGRPPKMQKQWRATSPLLTLPCRLNLPFHTTCHVTNNRAGLQEW